MPYNVYLPFPCNSTASAFDTKIAGPNGLVSVLPTATGTVTGATPYRQDLAGHVSEWRDEKRGNTTYAAQLSRTAGKYLTPGTLQPMKLRAVQASAEITTDMIGQLFAFVTTSGEYGSVVTETTAQGTPCKPLYGAYPVGTVFAAYDWFWVVEAGPCYVTVANGQTVAAQGPVTSHTTDGTAGPAAAADFVVGTSIADVTGNTDTPVNYALIHVKEGVDMVEA